MPLPPQITFIVPGKPVAQGSKRPVRNRKTGGTILLEQLKDLGPWRERVALAAASAAQVAGGLDSMLSDVPVAIEIEFVMPRAGNVAKTRPTPPAIKRTGDIDKLCRAILDAITHVLINDDCIVVDMHAKKRIAELNEGAGAIITVKELSWPK